MGKKKVNYKKGKVTNKKRKGYKACDPFCSDKIRVALYNRPNGPVMGKIIPGKTNLSGLDNKCFSRTGRIKKGYRNVPVDSKRDFEIEKRNINQLNSIMNHKIIKKKSKSIKLNKSNKRKKPNDINNDNNDSNENNNENNNENETKNESSNKNRNEKNDNKNDNKNILDASKQTLDTAKRLPNETFSDFVQRVNYLEFLELTKDERKSKEKIAKKQAKRKRRIERKIEQKRQLQAEKKEIRKKEKLLEKKKLKELSDPKAEKIEFGETNNQPPNLTFVKKNEKAMLAMKMSKKDNGNNNCNNNMSNNIFDEARKVNLKGVSFANSIQERAKQIEYQRAIENYKLVKQRRRNERIIAQTSMKKKRK